MSLNMSLKCQREELPEAGRGTAERKFSATAGRIRSCCDNFIEPRLIELRDDSGQMFFSAVWHCPTCGRVTC